MDPLLAVEGAEYLGRRSCCELGLIARASRVIVGKSVTVK